jgi:hypothetical protein
MYMYTYVYIYTYVYVYVYVYIYTVTYQIVHTLPRSMVIFCDPGIGSRDFLMLETC